MKQYILGIDLGTTGIRIIIFDHELNMISTAYSEFKQYFPKLGWVEHDVEEIYNVTMKVIKQALNNGKLILENIAAIGVANQRDTTVFWNKDTGKPVGKAIVWQDRRTLSICEELKKNEKDITERTGMVIVPNAAATKIHWLIEHHKEVKEGIEKGELLYGTIDSWIIWKLSGGELHVTDHSNNSVTLLQNAATLDYDDKILKQLNIPREILPRICHSSEIVGYTAKEEFFGARIPIAGVIGDQQAAAIGQGCLSAGVAKNTYGTGSFILMNTGKHYIPPSDGVFSPIIWSSENNVNYGLEGMADVSGAAIQWLRDGLGIIQSAGDAEKLALQVDSSEGVYFVPAFVGLGVPYYDSYARGTLIGLSRGTDKRHIARAALESMAFQVGDSFKMLEKKSGMKLKRLRVDGGGAKSDLMLQFQADILGVVVERPEITETTCLGGAYMAGLAVGYWGSIEEVSDFWRVEKSFEPSIGDSEREERTAMWKKAVERAGGWLK